MSGRNGFPFTASQYQELEHQALIFKYMVSGIPIPPDLLFTLDGTVSRWIGRKVDPEPGRCRRTDGKKWRCSKEAYPDSKYCERHMHRGKNRSRKPVEVVPTASPPSTSPPRLPSQVHHPFMYPHASRPPGVGLSPQENTAHSLLDSGSYSQTNTDYRRNSYVYRLKEEVGEHAFFSEPSGAMRSFSGSSVDDSWQLAPLTMSSSSSKQRSCSGLQSEYSYLQLQSLTDHSTKQSKQEDDEHCYINLECLMNWIKENPQRQYSTPFL
ncbi:hypothetical protein GQ457_03G046920 [Hibiscus cannabinus]